MLVKASQVQIVAFLWIVLCRAFWLFASLWTLIEFSVHLLLNKNFKNIVFEG